MTPPQGPPLVGVPGRLFCLAGVVLAAAATGGTSAALALAFSVLLAAACHRAAFKVLGAWYVWAMLALLVLPAALLGGPPRRTIGPFEFSMAGAALGAQMGARALAMLLAAAGFAATVPVVGAAALLERFGLAGLGFSLGVAINMLPVLQSTTATTWQAFRQRGGFRRGGVASSRLLLATVVSESLRKAEDVVAAAHARGFGAGRRPIPVARGRADLVIAAALAAVVALIWFL